MVKLAKSSTSARGARAVARPALSVMVSLLVSTCVMLGLPQWASAAPSTWTPISVPGLSSTDNASYFAVDGAGNIYFAPSSSGMSVYTPSTGSTVTVDSGFNFRSTRSFTVDAAGNIYAVTGGDVIDRFSASGSMTVLDTGTITGIEGIATDAAGNLYVASTYFNDVSYVSSIYKFTNGVKSLVAGPINDYFYGIAVGPTGNIYAANYGYGASSTVYQITPSGSVTTVGSGWSSPEGVAVDSLGNVYVADEDFASVMQVSPSGTQTSLTPANSSPAPDHIFYSAGTLYYWDEDASSVIYSMVVSQLNQPTNVTGLSTLNTVGSNTTQILSASWTATPGATSYTCRLMYAFQTPSTFTTQTTSTTCYFLGLSPTTAYGIGVTANNGLASSAMTVVFPPLAKAKTVSTGPTKKTITCVRIKGKGIRRVTAVNPHCPPGFKRHK